MGVILIKYSSHFFVYITKNYSYFKRFSLIG
nr:MAG TPA: hypothetical protein [Caudoviricetes sp.]